MSLIKVRTRRRITLSKELANKGDKFTISKRDGYIVLKKESSII